MTAAVDKKYINEKLKAETNYLVALLQIFPVRKLILCLCCLLLLNLATHSGLIGRNK